MTTKVYKYGLLPPTSGAELVAQQCDLAWRSAVARLRAYEAYRDRRELLYQQQSDLLARVNETRQRLEQARAALRRLRKGRKAPDSEAASLLRVQIRELVESLKASREAAKAERVRVREAGGPAALDRSLKDEYLSLARTFAAAGLFWGQRQLVEAAHDQRIKARDRLRIPEQWGAVGIQVQGGLSVDRLATDARVQITPEALPIPGRHGKPRQRLRLRIAPGDGVAEWPIILHRPLPDGASIRFVKVVCESVGRRIVWTAHFTVVVPDVTMRTDGAVVVVRPTFARQTDGWLIVAEGRDAAGPLLPLALHPRIEGALAKVADLRGIRDKARDRLLADLAKIETRPEWWPEKIAAWESCDRLRRFITQTWGRQRWDGDDELWDRALVWAVGDGHRCTERGCPRWHGDRHLWDWERHASRKALGRRLHMFRTWAAGLATQYGELVIPATDYRIVARRRSVPERAETELSAVASRQRMLASPGLLRRVLVEAFQSRGGRVRESRTSSSVEAMWRERSGTVERVKTARKAKFSARHKVTGAEDENGSGRLSATG